MKSSRTAFEKMIDWELKKRGLEETNNYKNNIERMKSKGFLDSLTAELIQAHYRCLSNIAVQAKGDVPPGFHEAQMGYGLTLIKLKYFSDKLPWWFQVNGEPISFRIYSSSLVLIFMYDVMTLNTLDFFIALAACFFFVLVSSISDRCGLSKQSRFEIKGDIAFVYL